VPAPGLAGSERNLAERRGSVNSNEWSGRQMRLLLAIDDINRRPGVVDANGLRRSGHRE